MTAQVQLVFRGETLSGFSEDQVRLALGRLLKLDDDRVKHLFSGARAVLKRSLSAQEAQRYVDHLERLGARIHIEPMNTEPAAASPKAQQSSTAAPLSAAQTAPSASAAPATPAAPVARPLELVPDEPEQITCPKCADRQSKRILCRSCATDMPMGIANRIEEEEKAREARRAQLRARGLKSFEETHEAPPAPALIGWGFDGRLGRLTYATANVVLTTILFLLTVAVIARPNAGRILFSVLGGVALFALWMRLAVLRCHDCGRHGWWSLLVLVPYAGTIASLLLSFLPGDRGANEFGEAPRKGRWRGLLFALLGMALAIALMFKTLVEIADRYQPPADDDVETVFDAAVPANIPFSPDAAIAFQNDYAPARRHKAFAIAGAKGWGFKTGARTAEEAMRGAFLDCEARREPYTPHCRLVNVDGLWAPDHD